MYAGNQCAQQCPMLGAKQKTYAQFELFRFDQNGSVRARGTSVLPSGADIVSMPRQVRLVPKRKSVASFNHLVGAGE
jgi:hypothetical protein